MTFLDTSCFIYLFEDHPQFSSKLVPIFDSISSSKTPFYTSIITLAETITKPYQSKQLEIANKYVDIFNHTPNLVLLEPTQKTSVSAAKIRAEHNFTLLDSLQLALAVEAGCDTFLTNDKQLQKSKQLQVKLIADL